MTSGLLSSSPPQINSYMDDGIETRLNGATPEHATKSPHNGDSSPTNSRGRATEVTPLLRPPDTKEPVSKASPRE